MTKKPEFQTIDVKYPKKLYSCIIWLNPDRLLPFFLHKMHKNLTSLKKYSLEAIEEIRKRVKNKSSVLDVVLVMPAMYMKDYPLNKKLWGKPPMRFNSNQRDLHFLKALDHKALYNLLVTPDIKKLKGNKNKFEYTAAFPFLKTTGKELDVIMLSSDIYVSPEAKNAAIYNIGDSFGYDLLNDEVVINEKTFIN